MNDQYRNDALAAEVHHSPDGPELSPSTTVGVPIRDGARLYTYQCMRPVSIGDRVNVKLPSGVIVTCPVKEVHDSPQLSTKWDTKWCVVVQTAAEYETVQHQASELGKELGLAPF